jgi:hypothetical protein
MAVCVIFDFPGATSDQYDEVCRGLNDGQPLRLLSQWPGGGIISHVAGPTSDGWCVVDVWESEDAFQRFAQRLMPLAEKVGFPPVTPRVLPVHNVVTQ